MLKKTLVALHFRQNIIANFGLLVQNTTIALVVTLFFPFNKVTGSSPHNLLILFLRTIKYTYSVLQLTIFSLLTYQTCVKSTILVRIDIFINTTQPNTIVTQKKQHIFYINANATILTNYIKLYFTFSNRKIQHKQMISLKNPKNCQKLRAMQWKHKIIEKNR